jgi:predicted nucleotidyltransferase component of viral defense system
MGGTCIHIVHANPRFSEDLDFDNLRVPEQEFEALSESVRRALELEGYAVELTLTCRVAFRAHLRFKDILFESGLTGHREAKLRITIDVDPQRFPYEPEPVILNKFDVFSRIQVVPEDILLSQKLCCLFTRKRPMGRDFFDTVYLMGKTAPHMEYLEAKLGISTPEELKSRLLDRCGQLDFDRLAADVRPFLHRAGDVKKVHAFREYVEQAL